jgi:hypothetical protein
MPYFVVNDIPVALFGSAPVIVVPAGNTPTLDSKSAPNSMVRATTTV